jgi:hypothetical protein
MIIIEIGVIGRVKFLGEWRPEPAALAFSYAEPGQSPFWAVTLAWLGPAQTGSAWPGFRL